MDCQAPILPILGKPTSHVGLFDRDDASRVPSLALSIAPYQAVSGWWVRPPLAHLPAFRIDGQSLPEGRGISWFTQGWESHPSSAVKLSGVAGRTATSAPHPQATACFEGTGRTHSSIPTTRTSCSGGRESTVMWGKTGLPGITWVCVSRWEQTWRERVRVAKRLTTLTGSWLSQCIG
jgi:hypothetical protein